MKDGMSMSEYTDFFNHFMLQEFLDSEYQEKCQKDEFPNGIIATKTR